MTDRVAGPRADAHLGLHPTYARDPFFSLAPAFIAVSSPLADWWSSNPLSFTRNPNKNEVFLKSTRAQVPLILGTA